jgi:hypothetical protein
LFQGGFGEIQVHRDFPVDDVSRESGAR